MFFCANSEGKVSGAGYSASDHDSLVQKEKKKKSMEHLTGQLVLLNTEMARDPVFVAAEHTSQIDLDTEVSNMKVFKRLAIFLMNISGTPKHSEVIFSLRNCYGIPNSYSRDKF